MRISIVLLLVVSCIAYGQVQIVGGSQMAGQSALSSAQPAATTVLTLSTMNAFAPAINNLSPSGCVGAACFPSITSGGAGCTVSTPCPSEGYQGGRWLPPDSNYPNGAAVFIPWQYGTAIPQGVVLVYKGGPGGVFHCVGNTQCLANWEWFDLTTLGLTCPATFTCPTNATEKSYVGNLPMDNNGWLYFIPDLTGIAAGSVFIRYNTHGSGGFTNAANYQGFIAPCQTTAKPGCAATSPSTQLGSGYGWCGATFDGRYIYYAPTKGGTTVNNNVVRYDTTQPFTIQNFQHVDLSTLSGGSTLDSYLSAEYDGVRYVYFMPTSGAMARYDTQTGNFTSTGWSFMNLSSLGTSGHPQVIGISNLAAIQANGYYVGGQMVWNSADTVEYMYMAPFATKPCAGIAGQSGSNFGCAIPQSQVIRMPVATCSGGTPGAQGCAGTFTPLDIFASGFVWGIYDLAGLTTNQAWTAGGLPYPPLLINTPHAFALGNQLSVGGFQLTWLNTHNTADPIVGFVTQIGQFFVRHHVGAAIFDPSGWDVSIISNNQFVGCMGGGYDTVNQLLYEACPAASPGPSTWQIGPF